MLQLDLNHIILKFKLENRHKGLYITQLLKFMLRTFIKTLDFFKFFIKI